MCSRKGRNIPIASALDQCCMACFAQVCLSVAVLDPNLEHWDNVFFSSLNLPYPLSICRKKNPKTLCMLWDTKPTEKMGYKPFEMLDKSLIHIPTGSKT